MTTVNRPQFVADMVTAILLAAALWCAVVGGPALFVGGVLLSLSPPVLVYAAGCIQIARHLLWPTPSLVSRLKHAHALVVARPNVAAALRAFVATRPAVFVIAFMAVITLGFPETPGFVLSRDPMTNLPARYDAGWYGDIALDGYTWDHTFQRQRNIAFFPALPMLMRPVAFVFGMYDTTVRKS